MQDEVNQDYSEQNEVDGMKKGADSNFLISCCSHHRLNTLPVYVQSAPSVSTFRRYYDCNITLLRCRGLRSS